MLLDRFRPEGLERNFRLIVRPSRSASTMPARPSPPEGATGCATRSTGTSWRPATCRPPRRCAILERGYAVVRLATGRIVRSAAAVSPGDTLDVRVAVGRIDAEVKEAHPDARL